MRWKFTTGPTPSKLHGEAVTLEQAWEMAGEGEGEWRGSTTMEADLVRLRVEGFLGTLEEVAVRATPEGKISPAPQDGERVVFADHLDRGLALPVSLFLAQFLRFYGIQTHHLGANSIAQLSAFVVLCEAYLGIWPSLDLFVRLHFLRVRYRKLFEAAKAKGKTKATGPRELVDCGCAVIYR